MILLDVQKILVMSRRESRSHAGVCYRRELDSYRTQKYSQVNGATLTDSPEDADVIALTACGYKEQLEKAMLRQVKILT